MTQNVGYPGFPNGVAPIFGNATGANALMTASLTGLTTGQTAYLTSVKITAGGATAATMSTVQITGLTSTMTVMFGVPAGAGVPAAPMVLNFNPALPASAVETDIKVTVPALGTGNTHASVVINGFKA